MTELWAATLVRPRVVMCVLTYLSFDVSQRWKGVKENMLDYYWRDLTIVSTVSCLQTKLSRDTVKFSVVSKFPGKGRG